MHDKGKSDANIHVYVFLYLEDKFLSTKFKLKLGQ